MVPRHNVWPIRSLFSYLPALLTALAAGLGCDRFENRFENRFETLETPWLSTTGAPRQPPSGAWVGHRGALLQGVAADGELPTRFGDGLNTRWVIPLPGTGNSSPTIYGDRLFLTAETASQPPELLVLCFDSGSGSLVWQQSVGPPIGGTHHKNGYATATVATDGQRLYATFGAKGIFCFSIEGQRLWHASLDHLTHEWGHASSPILWRDLVIQLADGSSGSYLLALNSYSGEVVWSTERLSSGSWTTPVLVSVRENGPAQWEVVVNGTGSTNGAAGFVIAYDPETGNELWRVRGTSDIPCPSAIVGASWVVSTSGPNGPIFAVRPGGRGNVTHSHVAWQLPSGGAYVPSGLIDGPFLYLITDAGMLRCLALADGQDVWAKQLRRSCNYSASLVAGDGKLFAVSEQGDIHVLATGDRCQVLAVNRLRQRCLSTPAIARGDLFVRTQESLYCFANLPTLAHESTAPAPSETLTPVSTSVAPPVSPAQP